jgi:hypothetical protein
MIGRPLVLYAASQSREAHESRSVAGHPWDGGFAAPQDNSSDADSRLADEPLAVVIFHDVKQRAFLRSRGALLRPGSRFSFCVHP